jgi:hypothetical protein
MAALTIRTAGAILHEGEKPNPYAQALVDSFGKEVAGKLLDEAKAALMDYLTNKAKYR